MVAVCRSDLLRKPITLDGKMDMTKYRTILDENATKDSRLEQIFTFKQSNPKHTIGATMDQSMLFVAMTQSNHMAK